MSVLTRLVCGGETTPIISALKKIKPFLLYDHTIFFFLVFVVHHVVHHVVLLLLLLTSQNLSSEPFSAVIDIHVHVFVIYFMY